jgi:hypothetical protein
VRFILPLANLCISFGRELILVIFPPLFKTLSNKIKALFYRKIKPDAEEESSFSPVEGKTCFQLCLSGAVDWQLVAFEQKNVESILPHSGSDELTGDNLMGFGGMEVIHTF